MDRRARLTLEDPTMRRPLCTGIALAALLAGSAGATQPTALADVQARGSAVDWTVLSPYEHAVLTVSTPDGEVVRSEIGSGEAPTFSAFDEEGAARPDGPYYWELRLDPIVAPDVHRRLAAALARGDERAIRTIQRAHGLDRELVQSGTLALSGGAFVASQQSVPDAEAAAPKLRPVTAADQIFTDDVIIKANACVGAACATNMSFGIAPSVVRSTLPNLMFDDTSSSDHDWAFFVNGFFTPSNQFALADVTTATQPLTILGGAPTNSIFVDSIGRVGLGTSTPARTLHIKQNSPVIRLERTSAVSPQTWEIRNDGRFAVQDVTIGGEPFSIAQAATPNSIHIAAGGNVGIGTPFPEARLHVVGNISEDTAVGIGPSPDGSPADQSALNVGYAGGSFGRGAGFLNIRQDTAAAPPNPSLRFLVADTERMILDNEGFLGLGGVPNPANPIQHANGAVLTAGGQWQSVSSRASKRDIRPLEVTAALAALDGLEPVRFFYKAEPADEYLGFVAEDVPDLVATADHERLGPLDIVAVLTKVAQQQQATIEALAARLAEVERRQGPQQP
jgi:hypothetical protein